MGIDVGHAFKGFIKRNPNPWGGLPVAAGAGDSFEFNSESLKANVAMVMNEGVSGRAFRRPGSAGNKTPGGDMDFDFFYRDVGLRILAGIMGADAASALGGGAHQHDLTLQDLVDGINFTLGFAGPEAVHEYGHAKVTGVKIRWDESTQRGKIMPTFACFDQNTNVGTPNVAFVVASVAAANGPLTILAPALVNFDPSPLTITKVAGVTALTVVIVAVDRKGSTYTRTITQADFVSNVFTDTEYVRRVVSITLSGVTGTGNISAGVSNGVNNITTAAALTTDSDRDCSLFSQCELLITDQDRAATLGSVAIDEQFISSIEIGIERNMDSRVTSQFGDRIEEPKGGGGGWGSIACGINFSALTDRNRRFLHDRVGKNQLRAKLTLTGPPITGTSTPHSIEIWMNGLQFAEGDANIASSGVRPFDLSAEAHSVVAVPADFPAGVDEALFIRIKNGLSTGYLA
jgi:hypothetical protein